MVMVFKRRGFIVHLLSPPITRIGFWLCPDCPAKNTEDISRRAVVFAIIPNVVHNLKHMRITGHITRKLDILTFPRSKRDILSCVQ